MRKRAVVFLLLLVSCFITLSLHPISASATAGINPNISFTGKLVKSDNTNITDGTYNMEFKVYQDGTSAGVGSTLMWTEDYLVAGSTGMPSTGGVTLSSGTFSINLGSICAFAGGTCGAKTNTGVDFNQNTLWASVQIGNTTSCTVTSSVTSFNTACGGDGEMSPYIRLTAVPYAANAALLSGIAVTALGQLASNQTWTGTQTFQPTTNISSALIKQTSVASPTADIFNIQTANATTLMQFTGPSANASNIVLQSAGASSTISVGTNAIANNIQIGDATTVNTGNTQAIGIGNLTVAGTTNVTIGSFTGATAGSTTVQAFGTLALQTAVSGIINIATNALAQSVNIGAVSSTVAGDTISIATSTGAAQNIDIGGTGTSSSTSHASTAIALQGGATVLNVANGGASIITYTNSTSAFQLQSSDTSIVANFDTSGSNANNLITTLTANGSENFTAGSTTGWIGALNGTAGTCTLTAVTAATASPAGVTPTNGNYMGQCANTATAGAEFKYTTGALTASTVYTFDFYASASSIGAANVATILDFGHVENAGGENVAGLSLTSQAIVKNAWTHYSLTFKTGATLAAGDYLYIKQNDATARSIWIDGVTFQTDPNADNNYREGKAQLFGTVTSSLILQNTTNSNTAFQVESAYGTPIFTVGTADTNLLPNAGAEVNATGWAGKGAAGATIIRDTSQQMYGYASFKITTTAASGDGAQYTGLSLPFGAAQFYAVSFSVKNSGTAFGAAGLVAGITNTAGDTNCVLSPAISATVPVTTGWTRFTCTVGPITTTVGTAFYVKTAEAVAHTFWVDGVELDSGSVLSPHGAGSLALNSVISSPMYLQNVSNSNAALTVYNTGGASMLNVDTLNSVVQIGSNITDTTQILFQLDSFSTFADTATCSTTTNQGSMYYNTATNAMRACISGGWEDLMSTAGMGIISFGVVADTGNNPGDLPSLVTPGVTGPCKVSWTSTTTVTVAPCTAYSGGRKVIVSSTVLTLTTTTTNLYENVCLTGTNGAPALVGPAATQNSATIMPTFSAASPILCLATLKNSSTVNGNFTGTAQGQIYDIRTFTQTTKEFQTTASALGLGYIAMASTTGVTIPTNTAGTAGMRGVVVASNGSTSSTNPNVILAVSGPSYVVAIAGTAASYVVVGGTTAGFAATSATTTFTMYAYLGMSRTTFSATCTSAATCLGSLYTDINLR